MASTYTTGFGIEKIGDGEQAGAWGTTTNHNLDILDRIASYTAVALSGTTHTLTIREASPESGTENLQDGMYRVIKFTGALGANNTVTIAPNTSPAWFIVENATTDSGSSGPYSVILTQGSGANVTVLNGKNAAIFCDGAGSGAVIYNALADLQVVTLDASGDITGSTLNADGDTAAGDAAAIGYTSAEGLILTGQGSTNDVTIKNDADADVITIATGATNVDVVGDLTAGTLNADGDTAAGDNATIGYTSAEGLILTGQGSTNDVTIKNDADADVITIATGGTNVDVVGDLTAGTLNADGDTAASDNAAIGYTSAEGLILTGQGSTNDVTIKNDADADVITIATGGTNVDVVGDLTAGTLNADGDTAAGDNATIGYTAAEGLILTGQGSTDDITVKNDADTTVVNVATGATDIEISAGNILFGTASKGVYLGVTSATAANLLSDYEEGTFTPALNIGGSTTGITYGNREGRYTKVGRIVTCDLTFTLSDKGSETGNLTVAGFPFTSVNHGGNLTSVASVGAYSGSWDLNSNYILSALIGSNSAIMGPRQVTYDTDADALAVTQAMIADDTTFYCSISYEAA
jgi:hypothetical protein